jgi:hypothetical protein
MEGMDGGTRRSPTRRGPLCALALAAAVGLLVAGCGSSGSKSVRSCVAGSESGVIVTVRGPTPSESCRLLEHVGRVAGWTGQPTLPAGPRISEACIGTDTNGNSVTVQTTASDPNAPVGVIQDALSANGYQVRSPIKWGSGC